MHVMLDQDQWEAANGLSLGDVLTDISEKAHARSRLITSLTVDQRTITDRDLDATFLGEPIARFTRLKAVSQTMDEVMRGASSTIQHYAELLRKEAEELASHLRMGDERLTALDAWLGKLADYLELVESYPAKMHPDRAMTPWVQALLEARAQRDLIRVADLLEYELAPRLEP
ncbi:hypothetical protein [Nitrospira lenta]|uniref:Uncharacterized protein n=1 Tax=Nitrospira lenta TaxID=1436998 RepID=A0A330L5P1_9BACT|nr:hypothetical protein [Nitrospira lenta]SPP65152.1 conserved hypothetical protein [Nitrospira lenta]